jgi:peptidyl-prolyl cis-trans isomerase A (cyclophilin A)
MPNFTGFLNSVVLKPLFFGLLAGLVAVGTAQEALPRVVIVTALGEMELEIDVRRGPVTGANFLRHVEAGLYDGGRFHRTVRGDNQAGNAVKISVVQGMAREAKTFGPIALERTSVTGLRHVEGTISMARGKADTASSQFFVCLRDEPELDFGGKRNADGQGFAAFGRVVRGLEVARRIQESPAEGQTLQPAVAIREARRVGR